MCTCYLVRAIFSFFPESAPFLGKSLYGFYEIYMGLHLNLEYYITINRIMEVVGIAFWLLKGQFGNFKTLGT